MMGWVNPFSYKNLDFTKRISKPDLVFALWKNNYHPGYIVEESDDDDEEEEVNRGTVRVVFCHNEEEKDVNIKDVICYHNNLQMTKVCFMRRGKINRGIIYGNDSPKHDGEIKNFFVKIGKRNLVSVQVRCVFLTQLQVKSMYCKSKSKH